MEDGSRAAGFDRGGEVRKGSEVGRVEGPLRLFGKLALDDIERRDGGGGIAGHECFDQCRTEEAFACGSGESRLAGDVGE